MDIEAGNFIQSSIVLLATGSDRASLTQKDVRGILGEAVEPGIGVDGTLMLTSIKKQVEIQIRRSRIDVIEKGGKSPPEARLGDLVLKLLDLIGGTVTAIGYNYELELPVPGHSKAGDYLASNFLKFSEVGSYGPAQIISCALVFPLKEDKCLLKVEPRWGELDAEKLYLNVNLHREVIQSQNSEKLVLTSAEMVESDFVEVFEEIKRALSLIPA